MFGVLQGVGMYQLSLAQNVIKEAFRHVAQECMALVGLDLGTCTVAALQFVPGMNAAKARAVVNFRTEHGPWLTRDALLDVPGIGRQTFSQAVGFLRVPGSWNPLDNTCIHPESFADVDMLLSRVQASRADIGSEKLQQRLGSLAAAPLHNRTNQPEPAVMLLADELGIKPRALNLIFFALGRSVELDVRAAFAKPLFRRQFLDWGDLAVGQTLTGVVRNVTDFGIFVDVGVGKDGLLHPSAMAEGLLPPRPGDTIAVQVLQLHKPSRKLRLSTCLPDMMVKSFDHPAARLNRVETASTSQADAPPSKRRRFESRRTSVAGYNQP